MHIALKTGINVTHLAARLGIIVCALCIPLSGLDEWVRGEQLASLRPFLAASAGLALIWFGLNQQLRWLAIALVCAAVHLMGMLVIEQRSTSHRSDDCIRTLVINAYGANPDQKRITAVATENLAEIVIVSELGRPLDRDLRRHYPHARSTDLDHVFGIGIYSKYPILDAEITRRGVQNNPVIRATLSSPTGLLNVVALHPLPPGDSQSMMDRDALIRELAEWTEASKNPIIVAGDFNTTTWSRHLRPLRAVAKRAPTGGTWPVWSLIKIPIDHIFFSGLSIRESSEVPGDFGSDHVPIMADLCTKN